MREPASSTGLHSCMLPDCQTKTQHNRREITLACEGDEGQDDQEKSKTALKQKFDKKAEAHEKAVDHISYTIAS